MIEFVATIKQFGEQGEKTGWTYIEVPADISDQLKPNYRKSFRVKGKLDNFNIDRIALLPMRGGGFIMAINATMRKGIGKKKGAMVKVKLQEDTKPFIFNKDLSECLADEPKAMAFFKKLAPSRQRYFSKWIDDAKTEATRVKRIAQAVNALSRSLDYGGMLRNLRNKNE